jgi:hypothetical protein
VVDRESILRIKPWERELGVSGAQLGCNAGEHGGGPGSDAHHAALPMNPPSSYRYAPTAQDTGHVDETWVDTGVGSWLLDAAA